MKRIIAIATLVAATGAMAQSTSTTDIDVSAKPLSERVGMWYYGELDTDSLIDAKQTKGERVTEFLNYLNVSLDLTSTSSIDTTFRMYLTDENKGNGEGDRYQELDQRVRYTKVLSKTASTRFRFRQTIELPTTDASRDANKIMRFKPALDMSHTFDDVNSLIVSLGFNKDIYTEAPAATAETSSHYGTAWISYTNTKLSEKYKFKTELELTQRNTKGGDDLNMTASSGEERLVSGINMDIMGLDVYTYAQHDPSRVKAVDQLGVGVQLFKAF